MASAGDWPRIIGRYALFEPFASGGMATVHLGKLLGEAGFSRTVAIKRLHENFVRSPEFVAMMVDEARLASRIRHPNVVPTLDVVSLDAELFVVMEYVHGASLAALLATSGAQAERMPIGIACGIVLDVLHGLHAAHGATNERDEPLSIVHRDVSPHNVLVGIDGVARVLDFGVAKAAGRTQSTSTGQIKGKLAYMAPEQMLAGQVDRRVDVYAAGIVLWEALTGRRLFDGENDAQTIVRALNDKVEPPSVLREGVSSSLDEVVMAALERDPELRFPTAHDFAVALEVAAKDVLPRARAIGAWVRARAGTSAALEARVREIARIDAASQIRGAPVDTRREEVPPTRDAETRRAPELPETLRPEAQPTSTSWSPPTVAPDTTPNVIGPTLLSAQTPPEALALPRTPSDPSLHARPQVGTLRIASAPAIPVFPAPARDPVGTMTGVGVEAPRPLRVSPLIAIAFGLLFVSGIVLASIAVVARVRARDRPRAPIAATSSSPPPSPPAEPSDVPSAAPVEDPEPPASASASAAPVRPTPPPKRPPPKPSADPCDPPFTIGADGVKVPKRACFK